MWGRIRLPACIAAVVFSCSPALADYEVTRRAGTLGDRTGRIAERSVGASTWRLRDGPHSLWRQREKTSAVASRGDESSFRIREVAPHSRLRAQKLLGELGAREMQGDIVIAVPGDVLFDFDRSDIRADARPVLGRIAELLKAYRDAPVRIEGHTDAIGSDVYNLGLSRQRAASVGAWLAARGIAARRMRTAGFGEARPVVANNRPDGSDDPQGRQRNRRVEIIIGAGPGAR